MVICFQRKNKVWAGALWAGRALCRRTRQFGARPLRRAVQRLIEDPLAERVLMGDFKAGETIYMDAQNGEMVFTTEPPESLPDSSNIVEEVVTCPLQSSPVSG